MGSDHQAGEWSSVGAACLVSRSRDMSRVRDVVVLIFVCRSAYSLLLEHLSAQMLLLI